MAHINDNILKFTGGPTVNEGLGSWYGQTINQTLNDALHTWLKQRPYTLTSAHNNDMWFEFLRADGYVGALSDMLAAYWAGPSRVIPTFAASQYGTLNTPITFTGDFEISIKTSSTESGNIFRMFFGDSISTGSINYLATENGVGLMVFRTADGAATWTHNNEHRDGKVHTITAYRIGLTVGIKLDGVIKGSVALGAASQVDIDLIGARGTSGVISGEFVGQILSVKFTDQSGAQDVVTDYVLDSGSDLYQLPRGEELTNINNAVNGEMEGTYIAGLAPNWSTSGSPVTTELTGVTGSAQGVESPVAGGDVVEQTVNLIVGKAYLIKGWIKVASGAGTATLRMVTGFLGGNFNVGTTTGSDWIEVSAVGIANASTTFLRCYSSATGVVAGFDNISVEKLPDSVCVLTNFATTDWSRYTLQQNITHDAGVIDEAWVGDDLVVNGTFDTDTDWVKGAGWSIGSGVASQDGTGGTFTVLSQAAMPIVDDNIYLTKYELVSLFGHADFAILEQLVNAGEWYGTGDSTGIKTKIETAAGSATLKRFGSNGTGAGGSVDNVSVQHLLEVA